MSQPEPRPHVIEELAPGVFWALLDFPSSDILARLLSPEFPLVLCWNHRVGRHAWEPFQLPITDPSRTELVQARGLVGVDFIVETERFRNLLPDLAPSVQAMQLARMPPDHFDAQRIRGKRLWRLLGEIGWHLWADIPGNDFGQIASPDRALVEQAVAASSDDG